MRRTRRAIGTLTLSLLCSALGGCTPKDSGANEGGVCDGVAGSCMDLLIAGSGAYSKLELTLGKPNGLSPQIISGGSIPHVPYHVRIVPPAGTKTSEFSSITARALNTSNSIEQAKIDGIHWPDGAHIIYTITLIQDSSASWPFNQNSMHTTFRGPASDIVMEDFDKDGRIDIAASINSASVINVAYGRGSGKFDYIVSADTDPGPVSLASADLNGDSFPDLATANFTGKSVTTFINGKNRIFGTKQTLSNANYPAYIKLIDFNGDGFVDMVHQMTATSGTTWTEYRIGKGDGSFGSPANTVDTIFFNQASIYHADMNRDGRKDLVVGTSVPGCNTLFIHPYDGTGFPKTNPIRIMQGLQSSRPQFLWVTDLNNDGLNDIAALDMDAESGTNAVEILLNKGDGLSYGSSRHNAGYKPARITGSDIDSDGNLELIVTNYGEDSVSVMSIDRTGRIYRTQKFGVGGQPTCITTADLNQDKRPDLIVCSGNGVDVFLNTTI